MPSAFTQPRLCRLCAGFSLNLGLCCICETLEVLDVSAVLPCLRIHHWHVHELLVKILDITVVTELWSKRRSKFSIVYSRPVNASKECMLLDFLAAPGATSQPSVGIPENQSLQQ